MYDTPSKRLRFSIQAYQTVLAFQYDDEDEAEEICVIEDGMTMTQLHRAIEDWEER